MIIGVITQQPADYLDYDIDCTTLFNEEVDTLLSCNVTVSPSGLTVLGVVADSSTGKVWMGLGTDGVTYTVTVTLTTTGGRVKEDEFEVIVEEQPE